MRNRIIAVTIGILLAMSLTACGNKQLIDTHYVFNKAIINTHTEVITVDVKSWKDYEDGDQIQITTTDGKTYLVHSSQCTLIKE